MRSILYFLLGFSLALWAGVSFAGPTLPYPGECAVTVYTKGNSAPFCNSPWTVDSNGTIVSGPNVSKPGNYYAVSHYFKYDADTAIAWQQRSYKTGFYTGPGPGQEVSSLDINSLLSSGVLSCQRDCPDSDSDGVCDACDAAPDDSTEGPDTYLHGYYTYGGKVVAVQHGGSSNKDNGYYTTVLDRTVPGAVIGGTGGIDEETFVGAGGQYRALQEGQKVMSTSCPKVTDTAQCTPGGIDCIHDYPDAGQDQALGDFEEVQPDIADGDTMPPGPDDVAEDDPYLDTPERDCPSYSSLCANSCGGSPSVARFACTEFDGGKKNVACECNDEGGFWTSPDYGTGFDDSSEGEDGNPDADDIENKGHSTGSSTIDGDTGTGGQPTDSDNDGDIDGYEQGERVVDFGPLMTGTGAMAQKFPFNLITSMKQLGDQFLASPECPSFSLPVWNQTITFDLCAFNGVAAIVRNLLGFLLTAACFWGVIKFFM